MRSVAASGKLESTDLNTIYSVLTGVQLSYNGRYLTLTRGSLMNSRTRSSLLVLLALACYPMQASAADNAPKKPNIIWIMADDLSYRDLGCLGQKLIQTPNIDKLAKRGMIFMQCYAGSAVCAPSRSTLMQGLHQGHATVRRNAHGGYRHSLQPGDVTVAMLLQKAGYKTGLFGKWGLANHDQPGVPWKMGFDEFFGYLNQRHAHNFYPEFLRHNDKKVPFPQHIGHNHRKPNKYDDNGRVILHMKDPSKAVYSADIIAEKSLNFIREHKNEPFFLYLAWTPPHGPLVVPELGPYAKKNWPTRHKEWAAMVTRLDHHVGRVLDLLNKLELEDNTIVFFCSDNGYSGQGYTSGLDELFQHAGIYRGRKGNILEGGIRVPLIVRWPGNVPPGSKSDHLCAFQDFLPTACDLAGVNKPANIDGISMVPILQGKPDKQTKHKYLYFEYVDQQGVRMGKWRAYRPHPAKKIELYDITKDPRQKNDLANSHPDMVRQIEGIFRKEHVQSLYIPDPGESTAAWRLRLKKAGVKVPNNVGNF